MHLVLPPTSVLSNGRGNLPGVSQVLLKAGVIDQCDMVVSRITVLLKFHSASGEGM